MERRRSEAQENKNALARALPPHSRRPGSSFSQPHRDSLPFSHSLGTGAADSMYSANYSDELRAPPGALHARGGGGGGVAADDVAKRVKDPILKTVDWAKNRPPKEKAMLAGGAAVLVRED